MPGTQFESSRDHHALSSKQRFPGSLRVVPIWRDPRMRFVSTEENLVLMSLSGAFVSARKRPFPGNGGWVRRDSVRNLESIGRKAQHPVLLRPFSGQVGEAGNAHAVRKSTVNCCLDEIRS